jgi:RNA polymerase sigma-70 factor (ECF subfamily)
MSIHTLALAESTAPFPHEGFAPVDQGRMRAVVESHFDFIWRVLRRLGVPEPHADDAAQEVFIVAARKMGVVTAAKERSFLFAVALRVAAQQRRAEKRRPVPTDGEAWAGIADSSPGPDELLDERRTRALMDQIVESIPFDQRAVFVLFEMEEMTMAEIAALMQIPMGTVASRLRRGRELFFQAVDRHKARDAGNNARGVR